MEHKIMGRDTKNRLRSFIQNAFDYSCVDIISFDIDGEFIEISFSCIDNHMVISGRFKTAVRINIPKVLADYGRFKKLNAVVKKDCTEIDSRV